MVDLDPDRTRHQAQDDRIRTNVTISLGLPDVVSVTRVHASVFVSIPVPRSASSSAISLIVTTPAIMADDDTGTARHSDKVVPATVSVSDKCQ